MAKPPFKPLSLAPAEIEARRLADGGLILRSRQELLPYPRSIGELLRRWAAQVPERTLFAERAAGGGWRRVSYGEALQAIERIAAALLRRGLDARHPLAILSENGIDFALLELAAMHVGIPAAPVSPAYSLMSRDHAQLKHILDLVRPGLVYAADGVKYAAAIAAAMPEASELVVSANPPPGRKATDFADLMGGAAERGGRSAPSRRSGPTRSPRSSSPRARPASPRASSTPSACSARTSRPSRSSGRFLEERPPVVVDWLPWSHTFGGNHNFNLVLRNGGTLYIDDGKPAPGLIETHASRTCARSRRRSTSTCRAASTCCCPTSSATRELARRFFRELDIVFYAAAALPQHLWERLERARDRARRRRRAVMLSAWGSTETAPMATTRALPDRARRRHRPAGAGHRAQARARRATSSSCACAGPNVTPGYWRRPDLTAARCSTRRASTAWATPASSPIRTMPAQGHRLRRPHRARTSS